MRLLTRPLGNSAVLSVHVSGTESAIRGSENQVLNCVKGEGRSWERCRVPTENWAARLGAEVWTGSLAVVEAAGAPGAKMSLLGLSGAEVDIVSEAGVRLRGRRRNRALLRRQSM